MTDHGTKRSIFPRIRNKKSKRHEKIPPVLNTPNNGYETWSTSLASRRTVYSNFWVGDRSVRNVSSFSVSPLRGISLFWPDFFLVRCIRLDTRRESESLESPRTLYSVRETPGWFDGLDLFSEQTWDFPSSLSSVPTLVSTSTEGTLVDLSYRVLSLFPCPWFNSYKNQLKDFLLRWLFGGWGPKDYYVWSK